MDVSSLRLFRQLDQVSLVKWICWFSVQYGRSYTALSLFIEVKKIVTVCLFEMISWVPSIVFKISPSGRNVKRSIGTRLEWCLAVQQALHWYYLLGEFIYYIVTGNGRWNGGCDQGRDFWLQGWLNGSNSWTRSIYLDHICKEAKSLFVKVKYDTLLVFEQTKRTVSAKGKTSTFFDVKSNTRQASNFPLGSLLFSLLAFW